MRRENIFWGLGLVLLGGLLLLDNMGLLPRNINVWALFWPLVLIGLGVAGILRAISPRASVKEEALRLPVDGARGANIRFRYGAGELRLDDRAGPGELINGSFGGGVIHTVNRSGDQVDVDLRLPTDNWTMNIPFDSDKLRWTVGMNPEVPLYLDLEVGASRNFLDLRNLQVKDLRLQTGASATDIDLPVRAGQTRASIKSGAASVEIRVPPGVSAEIHTTGGLSSFDVDTARFPGGGNLYRSPDYDAAANRVELHLEMGVGSIKVR